MQESKEPNDEIDYLHPTGKPLDAGEDAADEDGKPSVKQLRLALDEADGHYMPTRDPYMRYLKRELKDKS